MIHEIVCYFVKDDLKNNKRPSEDSVKLRLGKLTTKQIVAKLAKLRRQGYDATLPVSQQLQIDELSSQIKSLQNTLYYRGTKRSPEESMTELEQIEYNASVGRAIIIRNANPSTSEIDLRLNEKLDVPVRPADVSKKEADARLQLYIILLYFEEYFPKLKMSTKASYSKKKIQSAALSGDGLEDALKNLFLFVGKYLPTIRSSINQGKS